MVASVYEIGNVGTVIFVSYLGSRRHIPVLIGIGVIMMGIGAVGIELITYYLINSYAFPCLEVI